MIIAIFVFYSAILIKCYRDYEKSVKIYIEWIYKESNITTINWTEEKLAHAQHCKCYLKGILKPIQLEVTEASIKIIESIQKLVAKNISRERIVIEVNLTSNTSIGKVRISSNTI